MKTPLPTVETITPEKAEQYLSLNTHNRSIRNSAVEKYAEAMKNGQWELNGETIKFSVTNVLLDGQHRLWAILESKVPIKTYVIRGLPDAVFDTIDTGAVRHARDNLKIQGHKNSTTLSIAARFQRVEDLTGSIENYGKMKGRSISNRDILETVQAHPKLEDSVHFISSSGSVRAFLSPALAAFLHYHFSRVDPSRADYFMGKLCKGDGLEADDPILVARNRLASLKSGSDKGRTESAAIAIKAWNLIRAGKKAKAIRWPNVMGEEFPKIK